MKSADTIAQTREPHREDREAQEGPSRGVFVLAESEVFFDRDTRGIAMLAQEALGEREVERLVTFRNGSVSREHRVGRDDLVGFLDGEPRLLPQLAHTLDAQEDDVTFVEVPNARIDVECAQESDTTDTEHELLRDSRFAIADVEPVGDLPVLLRVSRNVRVEKVEIATSDDESPRAK